MSVDAHDEDDGSRSSNSNTGIDMALPLYQLEEIEVESEGVVVRGGRDGADDVSMPRHDPHIHHSHNAEDELDLERELEILLQSPMLFSSSSQNLDLELPSDPQFDDLESDFALITGCTASAASHRETTNVEPSPTTLDGLINTIFDYRLPSGQPPITPQPAQHVTIRPLLLPAPPPTPQFSSGGADPLAAMPPLPSQVPIVHLPVSATVALTHKPRGSHGVWLPLNDSQRIRVTKGKGKRLRVEVRSNNRFTWQEMQLSMIDCDSSSASAPPTDTTSTSSSGQECPDFTVCPDRSTVQDDDAGGTTAVVEVHVSRVRAKLQFCISIQSAAGGWAWRGQTVPFITHNNGKDRVPRRKRGASSAPGLGK